MCTAPVFDNYNYSHPVTPHFAVHCLIIDLMILCVLGGGVLPHIHATACLSRLFFFLPYTPWKPNSVRHDIKCLYPLSHLIGPDFSILSLVEYVKREKHWKIIVQAKLCMKIKI